MPLVRVRGLASLSLSPACGRLAGDWHGICGLRPRLAYSCVGPERTGTKLPGGGLGALPKAGAADGPDAGIRRRGGWMG